MKIERAEAISVRIPLRFPFETSYGRQTERESILVRVHSKDGDGWGEAAVSEYPDYCYETPEVGMLALSKYILPHVVGKEFATPEELSHELSTICGYPFVKTGVETAFIDMYTKALGVPIHQWLGGERPYITPGISLGIEDDFGLLTERIDWALEKGYARIKLKIKRGRDVSVVSAVRENFGGIHMMVDANCAYTLDDLDRLKALDGYGLMMIEQPLSADDLADHADLQRRINTHICLDESIRGIADLRAAVALGACRVINIKYGRIGGLVAAKRLASACIRHGIAVWCGGMLETGIGRAHNLALNSLMEFSLPGDISASDRYWDEPIIDPPVEMEEGRIELPEGPGIGFTVLEDKVKKFTTASIEIKS